MDRATEERWRTALQKKGVDVVRVELDLRPGPASELMYDVVEEPPYPTRAFCEQWCNGAKARSAGVSAPTAVITIMAILFVVCVIHAIGSWSDATQTARNNMPGGAMPPQTAAAAQSGSGLSNPSIISTTSPSTILPACSAVSAGANARTVQNLSSCSNLGSHPGASRAPHS